MQQIILDNPEYIFMNLDYWQYLDPAVFKSIRYLAEFVNQMEKKGMQVLYSRLVDKVGDDS